MGDLIHIKGFNESEENNNKNIPSKDGWYWVLIDGYDEPTPCWFSYAKDPEDSYFLPGGMGDSSSSGIYMDEVVRVGPEIEVPNF